MILLGVFCPNSGKEPKLTGNEFAGKSYLVPVAETAFVIPAKAGIQTIRTGSPLSRG